MSEETGSARITMKELYLQVQKIQSMLEKLTNQLPSISDKLDELEKDVQVRLDDHEARIRKIEMNMWKAFGILGVVVAVGPVIIGFFQ